MNGLKQEAKLTAALVALLLVGSRVAPGQQPRADVQGTAHAKGIAVLRLLFPSKGDVSGVSLFLSVDGETYEDSQAGLLRGSPLFTSTSDDGRTTTIAVSLVGRFPYGTYSFLFNEPGRYYLRWGVGLEDKDVGGFKIYQTIDVGRATQADLGCLSRVSDPEFLRHLFGKDALEGSPNEEFRKWVKSPDGADFRSLLVIAELLEATRANEPGDVVGPRGGLENALKWADALLALAKEFPDSSYAPYAAYYAGCCYVGALGQENKEKHKEMVSLAGKESAYYGKAKEALSFAVERADAYLKPRVLYHQAFLHLFGAEFDRVDESLDEALEAGGREGTIQKIVDKLRSDMHRTREKQAAREQDAD